MKNQRPDLVAPKRRAAAATLPVHAVSAANTSFCLSLGPPTINSLITTTQLPYTSLPSGFNHCSITARATCSVIFGGTLMPIMYLPILSDLAM